MNLKINKEIRKILNEILKWDRWLEQKIDYWKKDGDYMAKEIKNWQKKLRQILKYKRNKDT